MEELVSTLEESEAETNLDFGVLDYPPEIVEDRDVWGGARVESCQCLAGEASRELDGG